MDWEMAFGRRDSTLRRHSEDSFWRIQRRPAAFRDSILEDPFMQGRGWLESGRHQGSDVCSDRAAVQARSVKRMRKRVLLGG